MTTNNVPCPTCGRCPTCGEYKRESAKIGTIDNPFITGNDPNVGTTWASLGLDTSKWWTMLTTHE